MSLRHSGKRGRQGGMVLISSLLLLLVVTILALAMFRTMGLAEKISGNVREKQRAPARGHGRRSSTRSFGSAVRAMCSPPGSAMPPPTPIWG